MGPNWGQQQRMRQQQQRQQQQQQQRQQQGYWWQQQQKKNQQAGKFTLPKNKVTGNVPPVQMQMPDTAKKKKGGCAQVISTVISLAFLGFVVYVVLMILGNI